MAPLSQLARTTEAYQRLLFFPEAKPALKYRGSVRRPPVVPDENIVGLCTQVKYVQGKPTEDATITFIVKEKRSVARLTQRQECVIPAKLPGYDAKRKDFVAGKMFK